MNRRAWIGAGVGVVLLALPVGLFLTFFHRVEYTVQGGFHGIAKVNPYLAAERFLTRMGVPTETRYAMSEPPPPDTTLMVFSTAPDARSRLADLLDPWVQAGGFLIVVASDTDDDPFMRWASAVRTRGDPRLREIRPWVEGDGPMAVSMGPSLIPQGTPLRTIRDTEGGTVALAVAHGKGLFVLLANDAFLTNESIGEHDHARFLWNLVRGSSRAVLLARSGAESLWVLLGRHAWPALVTLGLTVLAWAIRVSRRFGPVRPDPQPTRRSLLEHIDAAGTFLWRHRAIAPLLGPARRAAIARLERLQPSFARLEEGERVHQVAVQTGIEEARVRLALQGQPRNSRELVQVMHVLQSIGTP